MSLVTLTVGDQITISNGVIPLGTTMAPGQWVMSANSAFVLIMQGDGNLVLYQVIGAPPAGSGSTFVGYALWAPPHFNSSWAGFEFCVETNGSLRLSNPSNGVYYQLFTARDFTPGELILQNDGNLVLYDANNAPRWATGSNTPVWPYPRWVKIQSAQPDSSGDCPVLAAGGDSSGSPVLLQKSSAGGQQQLWCICPDGRILSGFLRNLLLTEATNQSSVAVQTEEPGLAGLWYWNDGLGSTTIQNRGTGRCLNHNGSAIDTIVPSDDPSAQWYFVPTLSLNAIYNLPASNPPFPAFTSRQEQIYQYFNSLLRVQDLRSEYTNLAAPVSSWQSTIKGKKNHPPSQFSGPAWSTDWGDVVEQLDNELTAVQAVWNLFVNYRSFHNSLFVNNSALLNAIGEEAGFEQGSSTNVGGLALSILSGVLYTVLEAVEESGVLGNVVQTAINVAVSAANVEHRISATPFQVAFAELWERLSRDFENLLNATGNIEQALLSDWTKLDTANTLITSAGPDSLSWPAKMSSDLPKQGFKISVLQMLLPAKYKITVWVHGNNDPVSDAPAYAQFVEQDPDNPQQYLKYWITDIENDSAYPSELIMNQLWNSGVSRRDFFTCARGWGFARKALYPFLNIDEEADSPEVVVTLTNLTANPLVVTAQASEDASLNPASLPVLAPYESIIFGSQAYYRGVQIDVEIADFRTGAHVASFSAHSGTFESSIDSMVASGGYQFSAPIGIAGATQISISFSVDTQVSTPGRSS